MRFHPPSPSHPSTANGPGIGWNTSCAVGDFITSRPAIFQRVWFIDYSCRCITHLCKVACVCMYVCVCQALTTNVWENLFIYLPEDVCWLCYIAQTAVPLVVGLWYSLLILSFFLVLLSPNCQIKPLWVYVKYSIVNILCLYYTSSLSVVVTRAAESDGLQLGGLLSILRQHSSLLHLPPLSPEEIKQVHETVIAVTTGRYWWWIRDSVLANYYHSFI